MCTTTPPVVHSVQENIRHWRIQGGAASMPPQGSRFFRSDIQILRNVAASGVGAPPPPPREILDPPLYVFRRLEVFSEGSCNFVLQWGPLWPAHVLVKRTPLHEFDAC